MLMYAHADVMSRKCSCFEPVCLDARRKRRLKWYGHVMRREEHYVGRRAMVMKVQGRRNRGRPKRRWLDKVKDDIKEKGLSADDVYDRATWRRMSSYIDPT